MHQRFPPHGNLLLQAELSAVAEIRRRYGDHLYAKHDYDAAMAQYVATIGFMEPSYVIRKFLDAQRIHNLTSYLEELHVQASFNLFLSLAMQLAWYRTCMLISGGALG